jgi:hypothetical protein
LVFYTETKTKCCPNAKDDPNGEKLCEGLNKFFDRKDKFKNAVRLGIKEGFFAHFGDIETLTVHPHELWGAHPEGRNFDDNQDGLHFVNFEENE